MPSPIGHALGAIGAVWATAGRPRAWRAALVPVLIASALGVAPDLDLLIHRHRAESHSVGAAAIVATIAAWRRWPLARSRATIWVAAFCAWASHPLLDALGADDGPPIGIMAFWPFSDGYVKFPWTVFDPISRWWRNKNFLPHNLHAVGHELLILVPIVLAIAWMRRARANRSR